MQPLPTEDIRSNLGTWAVPTHCLPALGHWMHDALPNETYDPHFYGQEIETCYFDTPCFDLRKARTKKDSYCTLRIRRYGNNGAYALSVKTESEKFRIELPSITAEAALASGFDWQTWLPPNLFARLLGIVEDLVRLQSVVKVRCRRYAIENEADRFTLDVDVHTNHGKRLPFAVLEMKGNEDSPAPDLFRTMGLGPVKLSKFLWATIGSEE